MDALEARTKQLLINGYTVTIHELTISKMAGFARMIGVLGAEGGPLSRLSGKAGEDTFKAFSALLSQAPRALVAVLAMTADVKPRTGWERVMPSWMLAGRFSRGLTLTQAVDLIQEIWAMNNIGELFQKKVLPLFGGAMKETSLTAPLRN